jgi:hypothetical protein
MLTRPLLIGLGLSIALGALVWQSYKLGKQTGRLEVQTLWDAEKIAVQQAHLVEVEKARQKEQELQSVIDKQQVEYKNEINRINHRHSVLVDSLRNRPDRPDGSGVPQDSTSESTASGWCSGSQLYRPDGEFLIGEATRADQLRTALQACLYERNQIESLLN